MESGKNTFAETMRIDVLHQDDAPSSNPRPRRNMRKSGAVSGSTGYDPIFESVYDGGLITDSNGTIVAVNQRGQDFFRGDESMCGLNIITLISGTDDQLFNTLRKQLSKQRFIMIQAYCVRLDGSRFPAEITVSRLQRSNQQQWCFFVRDITWRIHAEDALLDERNRLRTLIDILPDFISVKDNLGCYILANRALADRLGFDPEALVGKTDKELDSGLANQSARDARVLASGAPLINHEEIYVDTDGRRHLLLCTRVPLRDKDRKVIGIVSVSRDITEQRLQDHQHAHARKLESIGQLAAGIAHEINTPIQYVGDNLRFLDESFKNLAGLLDAASKINAQSDEIPLEQRLKQLDAAIAASDPDFIIEEAPEALRQALDGVARVTDIVRAMKEFSHPDTETKAPADLNRAISSTVTVARNEWKYVAEMKLDLAPDLPPVPCLVGHFNQVILNLVTNAAHAIGSVIDKSAGEKGRITISSRQDGKMVEIRVADTGCGMTESVRSRIFDPFFTTKDVGKGTGQGLSTCHAIIVRKHGGAIRFETREGRGTVFIIRLPIAMPADTDASIPCT